MLTTIRYSLLTSTACALAAFLPSPRAQAVVDTLNWGNSGYTYNAATQVGAAGSTNATNHGGTVTTVNGNTVSILYDTGSYFNNAIANSPSPSVGTYGATANTASQQAPIYTDGGTGGGKALQLLANFTDGTNIIKNAGFSVTVFFSKPVTGLSFSLYDIDTNAAGNATYHDLVNNISGKAFLRGGTVVPSSMGNGADNGYTLTPTTPGTFTGTASSAQNVGDGNGTVNFGLTPISSLTFFYTDTDAAAGGIAHSTTQIIALGNLSFTTVPEPSTWACFAMAGGIGAWTLRRRARRTV